MLIAVSNPTPHRGERSSLESRGHDRVERSELEITTPEEAERLAVELGEVCGDEQLAVSVLELLLNAIEHGNLEIGYDEKTKLLARGDFREEIERRLALDENADKRVRVWIEQRSEELLIEILDCGCGFDFARFLEPDPRRQFDSHGRGVAMANALGKLEYVSPGNRVRLRLPIAA